MDKAQARPIFLSIAIPVFNQAGTIKETICSALEAISGEDDVEIVVSENHSFDGTKNIVSAFGGRVKIVSPPSHLSMAANWNYAVNACSGQWVGMLSGDDKILPGYVRSIRHIVSIEDDAVFAYGGWNNVDGGTGMVERRTVLSMPQVSHPRRSASSLIWGPKASFASYCFLKSAFQGVGGFSEEYNLCQDWILQFRLSLCGSIVKSNCVIAEYLTGQAREELERRRAPLYLKDIVAFCSGDIWRACDIGVSRASVLRACEVHAARAENMLCRFPELKPQGEHILMPLYALIGKERIAIIQGRSEGNVLSRVRKMLRRLVQAFV